MNNTSIGATSGCGTIARIKKDISISSRAPAHCWAQVERVVDLIKKLLNGLGIVQRSIVRIAQKVVVGLSQAFFKDRNLRSENALIHFI